MTHVACHRFFANTLHIASAKTTVYLLAIINAASIPGRIVPNYLSDRFGPLNVISLCCPILGVLVLSLISRPSFGGLVLLCIFYGFFSGTWFSLQGPSIGKLCPSPAVIGTRMGMTFAIASIGMLVGNPIGGAILSSGTVEEFRRLWTYGGIVVSVPSVGYLISRMLKANWKVLAIT